MKYGYKENISEKYNESISINSSIRFNVFGNFLETKKQKIYLSLTESRLLLFFVIHPNKRIFVNDILDYFRKYSVEFLTEQNIYVYIWRLRKKIEPDPKKPQIILNLRPGYVLHV
jgi:DNA-binding response OmpR family regulator